jgi:2-polyprenyl-3-methyl-5-hydroxy-6-metoxy-1,4-benzoquinol methylase
MRVDNTDSLPYLFGMILKKSSHSAGSPPLVGPGHVCPWWLGPFLVSPLRRLLESPERILAPHVSPGMTVLEPGCGMGYFSLPLARLVGPEGKVICIDLQPRMIEGLRRRARRAGLLDRIESSVCMPGDLGLSRWHGRVDVAVAIHTVHEVGDTRGFLEQIAAALRPGGTLLFLEPRGHVSREAFDETIAFARGAGLVETARPAVRRRLAAVLVKRDDDDAVRSGG